MSLADAFNVPLTVPAGGRDYRLAFLGMNDHAELSRAQAQEQKAEALRPVALTDRQKRAEVTAYFDAVELDLYELARDASTLPGAKRVLRRSLAGAGHPPADADAFLEAFAAENGYMALAGLACRVSRLFPPVKADLERAFPNPAPASSGGQLDAGATSGSPSTSPGPSQESAGTRPASSPAA